MVESVLNTSVEARIELQRSDDFTVSVDMVVEAGSTTALLGPNGAGKSTVVNAIAGLLPIDRGRVVIAGTVVDDPDEGVFVPAEKRRVGVVFQDYLLFPHMTVMDNVAFGLRSRGLERADAEARSAEWLARMGLAGAARRRPSDLSGGQAQRVALARALVGEPSVLLLDEPLAALDVTTRSEMRHTLAEHLAGFEGPRLLITHDPTEAFLLADFIHVIEDGTVSQSGNADEIRIRPATAYAADLVGTNLARGVAELGKVVVDRRQIHVADDVPDGPVIVTIHPNAISVHRNRPEGSPRNSWQTEIDRLEVLGTRTRVRTVAPLALTVELTSDSARELRLELGTQVWVAVKATEIDVRSDPSGRSLADAVAAQPGDHEVDVLGSE